jgi:Na+/proline symporter
LNPQLLALGTFLTVQLGIGVWVSRRIASEGDYLLGGRRLGYLLTTFTLFATWFGAETVVSSSGLVLTNGISLRNAEPFGYGLCLILSGVLLARALWERGLTTLADLFRQRFGVGVERLAAIMLIPTSVFWAAAQIRAFGQVISLTAEVNVTAAISVAALFVIAYTAIGGLLADAINDVLQGIVLTIGLVVLAVAVVARLGGPAEAIDAIVTHPRLTLGTPVAGGWLTTLEEWAIPLIGSVAATEIVGRVIAARSAVVARRSAILAGAIYLAVGSIPVLIALVAAPMVPGLAEPEQVLPALARELLPPVLFAVFAGGLISAILSTVDSTLLVSSGIASHNLVIPMLRIEDERAKVRIARIGVAVFGLIAYVMALGAEGIFTLIEASSAFGTAGIVVTVFFALFTKSGSARTATLTLLGGIVVYLGAQAMGFVAPFLASFAAALLLWGIGCAADSAKRTS